MKFLNLVLLVTALLLNGCADPEQTAQNSLTEVKADWDKARSNLDPKQRLEDYQSAIERVKGIAKEYDETQVGQALAAGRSVGDLSQASMQSEYDRLAERADCYAKPTVECLTPFASGGLRNSQSGSADSAAQEASLLVCEQNFASADAALEPLKINRPVYAATLVQVALQAAQCNKPEELKAAIAAYMSAEPAQGAERISQLMSILNTSALQPAWPEVLAVVEKEAPLAGLDPGTAAGNDLTLAVVYAEAGDAEAALTKFNHVTQELGYTVDINTRRELASALMAGGNAPAGMELLSKENVPNISTIALYYATAKVGGRLGVIRPEGSATAIIPSTGDITTFFAPVDATTQKTESVIAGQIEAALDKFIAPLQPGGEWMGGSSPDNSYAMLAVIQQKLGAPDKATALIKKSEDARVKLSPPGSYNASTQFRAAEFELLVALGQGDTAQAVALLPRVTPVGNDPIKLVLIALADKGEAEQALTLASQMNRADGQTYEMLINQLGTHGHADKAEAVLNAFPGSDDVRLAMAWGLVVRAAQAGDMKSAQSMAEKYQLLTAPARRFQMAGLKAQAAVAAGDRGEAETHIREMFAIGEEIDKAGGQSARGGEFAQNAATQAFEAGYIDLGLELYQAAYNKDQRPLFAAFSAKADASKFPEVLMVAHDNLRGDEMGYVVDAAIRRLNQKPE